MQHRVWVNPHLAVIQDASRTQRDPNRGLNSSDIVIVDKKKTNDEADLRDEFRRSLFELLRMVTWRSCFLP